MSIGSGTPITPVEATRNMRKLAESAGIKIKKYNPETDEGEKKEGDERAPISSFYR